MYIDLSLFFGGITVGGSFFCWIIGIMIENALKKFEIQLLDKMNGRYFAKAVQDEFRESVEHRFEALEAYVSKRQ